MPDVPHPTHDNGGFGDLFPRLHKKEMLTMKRIAVMTVCLLGLAALMTGCGGDNSPTAVDVSDLQKDGAFWLSLDAPLRRELAGICHDQQVKEGPDEVESVAILQGLDTDDYVASINRQYEDEESGADVEEACEEAKQELLAEQFGQLVPHLPGN